MAHLDFKITSWKRVFVPNDKIQETIQKLKDGVCDAFELLEEEGYYDASGYDDQACIEEMLPNENNNCSTQELYDDTGEILYKNGTEDDE
jgi:hypothetical protein